MRSSVERLVVSELRLGEVIATRIGHSKHGGNGLFCDVNLDTGVPKKDVPFISASTDFSNSAKKNVHGIVMAPAIGQMVGVFHVRGHFASPLVAFPIPFPWGGGKNPKYKSEDFNNLLENINDIKISHKSGSKIIMKDTGDIEVYPADDKTIYVFPQTIKSQTKGAARLDDEIKSTSVEDSAFWTFINTTLLTTFNTHTHTVVVGPATLQTAIPIPVFGPTPTSLTGKITKSSNKVKIGGD